MAKRPDPVVLPVRIAGGSLCLSDGTARGEGLARRRLAGVLKHLADGSYEMEIRPFAETRRDRANRFYWGVVLKLMASESGYTADDLHEWLKLRHNAKTVVDLATGEEQRIGQSTAKLTVQAFSDYLEACMVTGAESLGIVFPEPRPSEDYREKRKTEAA